MEYLEGRTLKHRIAGRPMEADALISIALQICAGLEAAQAQGIVHRDIKPANIFITSGETAKILDFGLAKILTAEPSEAREPAAAEGIWNADQLTATGAALGTADYMSPEQVLGQPLDSRSDLFSVGAVLYEMSTGERAFPGRTSREIFEAILRKTPIAPRRINRTCPEGLELLIMKCLAKDREERFQDPSALRRALERLKRKQNTRSRFRRLRPFLAAAAASVLIASSSYWILRPVPPPSVSNFVQLTNDGEGKGPFGGPLVTDGSKLYFGEGSGMAGVISGVPVSGGQGSALSQAPVGHPEIQDISPARTELLVSNYLGFQQQLGWPLWSLPLPTGPARRVGNILATAAAWSPDGHELAYISDRDLYRARPDGSGAKRIARLPGPGWWLRWSPDGQRLRLTLGNPLGRFGVLSIWEVSADGKDSRPFLRDWDQPPTACCGSWTPDGKYFAFQATRHGKTEVWLTRERKRWGWTLNHEEGTPIQLTAGQLDSLMPLPDLARKKLYVVGQKLRGEINRYDGRLGQWVPYVSGVSAEFIDFSKDGRWVTYTGFPDGAVWRSRLDGSQRLQLTDGPGESMAPRWSPDGARIAFGARKGAGFWNIYVNSSNGGKPERLWEEEHDQARPSWSPDGKSIAFGYSPGPDAVRGIKIVDLPTRRISILADSAWLVIPTWSPDGRYIVARHSDHRVIKIFDFQTHLWRELVRDELNWFNWSHDSRYVYYEQHGENHAVMRVRIANGKVEKVVDLKNLKRAGVNGSFWFGLAPDSSPVILRDTGTQEIYALDWREP
jgi:eukaryotic-like serine/threonine-protein kinase